MSETPATTAAVADFLRRWEASGAAERANYQLFLSELCDLLAVPRPEPTRPDDRDNAYVFERSVTFRHGDGSTSAGRIDLYKRGHFVCEAKQGSDAKPPKSPFEKGGLGLTPSCGKGGLDLAPPFDKGGAGGISVREDGVRWSARKGTAVRGTKGWDLAMLKAKGQAEQYARALPVGEGWPPFLVVVDVGHAIEIYSEFSCTGKSYLPFPDPRSHRILLAELADEDVRERLRLVWTDPHLLDPSRHSAKVTRQVADRLAVLAKSLEQAGHSAEKVGNFLKRCLFTMFAEDVGLIPNDSFSSLLESLRGEADKFAPMAESLWGTMKDGGFSPVLREKLLRFNGGLFEEDEALPVGEEQLVLLIAASKADWRDVEPAIFGTLLERALSTEERHNLGAHYTPREYVERLVLPAVIEPLRAEWEVVLAAAVTLSGQGDKQGAIALVKGFHRKLCALRILDPACGSGNFLYVTFEHLKRLEGEVLNALEGFGDQQADLELAGLTVDPQQLLGIEVNPRAAAITDMVLWIGYLQWHFRTRGEVLPPEPVIKKLRNIECRDAVLAYDGTEPVMDADGKPVTRWDGLTTKTHPVTGEQVPDESARVPVLRYLNPRRAEWPEADFVVGNPPFIGASTMRRALGDGYVEALRSVWKNVPDSADFVMYWWDQAAELTRHGKLRRFGFITTNSLRQAFNRRVIERHLRPPPIPLLNQEGVPVRAGVVLLNQEGVTKPGVVAGVVALAFAIPDHPWVDSTDGAAVRIAMTVGTASCAPSPLTGEGRGGGEVTGRLCRVVAEKAEGGEGLAVVLEERRGIINADLTIGADVAGTVGLQANAAVSQRGFELGGSGFIVTAGEAAKLGLSFVPGLEMYVRPYRNGRDLADKPRGVLVIDLYGLAADEVCSRFPETYQWLLERVKPERDQNRDETLRKNWWLHRRLREDLRKALVGLPRYIATVETAKHRTFVFLDAAILPDNKLICVACDDAYVLGILSSRVHVTWALAAGGRLGVGNDPVYSKTRCFDTFPFPDVTDDTTPRPPPESGGGARQGGGGTPESGGGGEAGGGLRDRIRNLAEQLDAHRKRQQSLHPDLTLTGMYNVLAKLREIDNSLPFKGRAGVGMGCFPDEPHPPPGLPLEEGGTVMLTAKEKEIHEKGLVSVLKQLHDELDTAVADAYGWPADLPDEEILERLVALNAERAREEERGVVRWLRPEYQSPHPASGHPLPEGEGYQTALDLGEISAPAPPFAKGGAGGISAKTSWPKTLPEQVQVVREALTAAAGPITAEALARTFVRARTEKVAELLTTLATLGQVREVGEGKYAS